MQPIIINCVSRIPYSVLEFIGAPYFDASLDWCLGSMQVYVDMMDFGAYPIGIIYYGIPLYFCDNDVIYGLSLPLGFTGIIKIILLVL